MKLRGWIVLSLCCACGLRAAPPPAASVFLGAPVTDRAAWTAWAERLDRPALLQRAEQEAAKPFPAMEEEAYAAFKKTGDRLASQRIHGAQISRLETLFWAEAVEHKGRFIPALVETIDGFARERTWVMAASFRSASSPCHERLPCRLLYSSIIRS